MNRVAKFSKVSFDQFYNDYQTVLEKVKQDPVVAPSSNSSMTLQARLLAISK